MDLVTFSHTPSITKIGMTGGGTRTHAFRCRRLSTPNKPILPRPFNIRAGAPHTQLCNIQNEVLKVLYSNKNHNKRGEEEKCFICFVGANDTGRQVVADS